MELYLWVKAAHIISLIAWMAALFYLPRLFVYHTETEIGSEGYDRFVLMEVRLLRYIANPAMVATWIFGLWLMFGYVGWMHGWLHAKLVLVVAMTVFHHYAAMWHKDFVQGLNRHSPRFYRLANEVPTVLLIGIVILVVVKPF